MRRALASVLLAVIGSPLVTPLLFAGSRAELPACCRRDGRHHCGAGMAGMASPAMPSSKTLLPKCPFFPKPGAHPADSKFVTVVRRIPVGAVDLVGLQANHALSAPPPAGRRGAEQKRGPPSLS